MKGKDNLPCPKAENSILQGRDESRPYQGRDEYLYDKGRDLRINYVYFFFLFLFLALALRISYLQVFKRSFLHNLSQNQYYRLIHLAGKRGKVFDHQGKILASSLSLYSVFCDPALIANPANTAKALSARLNLPKAILLEKLKMKKRFIWLKRKISWEDKEKIEDLNLKGIGFIRENSRFYPQGAIASQVLGLVDIDDHGLEGIELFYNQYLKGKDGWTRVLQDSASREVIVDPNIITPQEGVDLILTLDSQIQYWIEFYLEQTVKEVSAEAASAVVMDALDGEILALASYPSFDPNNLTNRSLKFVRNRAITDQFEPGSVFKIVTLLAVIEENKLSDNDKFFCENGTYKIPGSILHDWQPYGELTFKEAFKKSSNIGVSKIAQSLGAKTLYQYIKRLGFGEKSGIDLPGEAKGAIKPPYRWSKTSAYIIPIGQEIAVNLVQLVCALASVANEGFLVEPHLVKEIRGPQFKKIISTKKKKIFSSSTAERAKRILIEVVSEGTGKRAQIEGVTVGGKTGTAQKYDPKIKRYSATKYQASFMGFVTGVGSPFVVGVTIDEPKKQHFGGVIAAPLFKKIAERVIILRRKD